MKVGGYMYLVSESYKEKIEEKFRLLECLIQIDHSQGTLNLTDKDLALGTLIYTEGSQPGEEFTVGGAVASDIKFTIMNKPEYKDVNFMGARVFVNIGLLVKEGMDAHFLQPSQPSKMPGFEEKWEWVPLGRFNIDDVKRLRNTIELKAVDNMINLDLPYSLSKLSYPATLYQIYVNICNVADVQVGTFNFPNMNYVVKERPNDELTLREVLGYVAELSGTFAKVNRNGALELRWYEETDTEIGPANRFNFKPSDDEIKIKGVMYSTEDTTYLAGSEDYAIDLTDNPLVSGEYSTLLNNIFDNVKDTVFTPYTSDWQGNPAIQAGDIIKQIDIDGKEYDTLVTKSVYKYRGRSVLEAKGLPEISRGYKGSTSRRIAQIKRVTEKVVGDQLTTLEQAQLNAMEFLANMLGGHFIEDKENGILYISDNPDIHQANDIWIWGINGYAHYPNGLDGEPDASITADGSIVAMLVAANIITANMVQTGILQSEIGNSFFDLDKGILRISHGGNVYSQMDINGFGKNYGNGMVSYLNDMYVEEFSSKWIYPNPMRITLPLSFKGRNASKIFVIPTTIESEGGEIDARGNIQWINRTTTVKCEISASRVLNSNTGRYDRVLNVNWNATPPYVDIVAYKIIEEYDRWGELNRFYRPIDFFLIVIGQ